MSDQKQERFWDLFHAGSWIGMSRGADLEEAKQLVRRCLPRIAHAVQYAEWFGRNDPRNCKTSGGNVLDPVLGGESKNSSHPLDRFLAFRVQRQVGARLKSADLFAAYCDWCAGNNERCGTATAFGRAMKERGFTSHKSNFHWWLDLSLRVQE